MIIDIQKGRQLIPDSVSRTPPLPTLALVGTITV